MIKNTGVQYCCCPNKYTINLSADVTYHKYQELIQSANVLGRLSAQLATALLHYRSHASPGLLITMLLYNTINSSAPVSLTDHFHCYT